jgi:hypothetical protein
MSYDGDPEWTKNIVLPNRDGMKCPTCSVVAGNVDEVMSDLAEPSYYHPRHIPPTLVFTCDNPECPDCDKNYTVRLSAVVSVVSITKGAEFE